ncbi:transposase [Escherichia coli]|uniref:Transposase n=1 Tax=Escherichia coli TaxID=562 RepID=A0A376P3T7_ECOLX|nr:transposase [Escherichia coli]
MRRIADLHAGEAKTDARDAAIIAEAARTLPHALRTLKLADEQIAELSMLCGFDDDLAAQTTQASNRIRGLLTQIHPALERVLGPRLEHPAVLDLLQRYPHQKNSLRWVRRSWQPSSANLRLVWVNALQQT